MKKFKLLKGLPNSFITNSKVGDIYEYHLQEYRNVKNHKDKISIQVIENNLEWFSEVKEKTWEVVSFKSLVGTKSTFILNSGSYSSSLDGSARLSFDSLMYEGASVKNGSFIIQSVKRLSDGVVFTVGDEVYPQFHLESVFKGKVSEFYIQGDIIRLVLTTSACNNVNLDLVNAIKVNSPKEKSYLDMVNEIKKYFTSNKPDWYDNQLLDELRNYQPPTPKPCECRSWSKVGVGSGDGNLFVHGDYDSVKAVQGIVLDMEATATANRILRKLNEGLVKRNGEYANANSLAVDRLKKVIESIVLQHERCYRTMVDQEKGFGEIHNDLIRENEALKLKICNALSMLNSIKSKAVQGSVSMNVRAILDIQDQLRS